MTWRIFHTSSSISSPSWGRSSKSETSLLLRLGPLPGEPTIKGWKSEPPSRHKCRSAIGLHQGYHSANLWTNPQVLHNNKKQGLEQSRWWGRGNLNHSASRKRQTSTLHTTPFGASFKISRMSGGLTPQWELHFVPTLLTTGDSVKFWGFLLLDPQPLQSADGKELLTGKDSSLTAGLRTSTNLTVQKSVTICITQQPVKTDIAGDCGVP